MQQEQLTALEALVKSINALAGGEEDNPLLSTHVINRGMEDDSTTMIIRCNHLGKQMGLSTLLSGLDRLGRHFIVDICSDVRGLYWQCY